MVDFYSKKLPVDIFSVHSTNNQVAPSDTMQPNYVL